MGFSRNSHSAEDAHFLRGRFPQRYREGPGIGPYYDDKVARRVGGLGWLVVVGMGNACMRVHVRVSYGKSVRRLYVARISNKLSADPLARSFIMTSAWLPARA